MQGGDKPYLVSGADDRLIKVWDYQNKSCVQTLDGHTHNVTAVCFHPELPLIVSGSEDGAFLSGVLRFWWWACTLSLRFITDFAFIYFAMSCLLHVFDTLSPPFSPFHSLPPSVPTPCASVAG